MKHSDNLLEKHASVTAALYNILQGEEEVDEDYKQIRVSLADEMCFHSCTVWSEKLHLGKEEQVRDKQGVLLVGKKMEF